MSFSRIGAAAAVMFMLPHAALGQDLWAVDNQGPPAAGTVGDRLIRIDRNNPSNVTVVGDIGVAGVVMTGLDFMPDLTLWAAGTNFAGFNAIYNLSTTTGASLSSVQITGLLHPVAENIADLAYNPLTGSIWAVTIDASAQLRTSNIYDINVITGQATLVSSNIMSTVEVVDLGMSIDSLGFVYLEDVSSDMLWRYDPTVTNALSSIPLGFNANFSQGMGMDWSRDSKAFVGAYTFDRPAGSENVLYTFDMILINYGFVGVIGSGVPNGSTGLSEWETGDVAIMPIPAPGAGALLGLVGLTMTARRRRR